MFNVQCLQSTANESTNLYAKYSLGPFMKGQSLTTGNALRRVLLSNLQGLAIVGARITGINHEFSTIPNVKEDVIDIWGSGNPKREFLWSEDMADACVFLLENRDFEHTFSDVDKEVRNTHINIGTGIDISIKELADQIKLTIGYKGSFNFDFSKPDGTMRKLTNVSKLHSLGWKHSVSLNKGVEKMYAWYLSIMS
jgi:nucleoside-diphosphate-sugar epimerase